ncbi:sugar kinase [Thioclava kandeliae]|uniref:Sugar kinase n=1 Tax=Thioclava kandeliae TaxID=3070818 RepID=A0ABV1SDX5_9RHOB
MRFLSVGECMLELSEADGDLWHMGIAGDTLNTAWYARAQLPAQWQVEYGTVIGRDRFSARIPVFLEDNGIGTGALRFHETRTIGLYAITLAAGERSFTYWRENSAARTLADDPQALAATMAGAAVIHISGITLAILSPSGREALIGALAQARAEGVMTVLDPNIRPKLWESPHSARDWLTRAAGAASVILPSFDDEAACFGDRTPEETCARYAASGARTVIVKNGGAGIMAHHAGEDHRFDALEQVEPVDTTGAGDSFNGACLAELATGRPLARAIAAGHDMARRVVRHRGALIPMADLV